MKKLSAALCLTIIASAVTAQQSNRLPQEEARRYAQVCVERAVPFLLQAPIKMEVDTDKACAERGEGGGAMIVPAKTFNAKALAVVGKDVIPVGQLWARKWTLAVNGKAVASDKLRLITVNVDDKDRPMPLFLLGLRKGEKDLELVVYGGGNEPLQVLSLQKLERASGQPLELDWSRGDKDTDNLTVNVLGKYQAVLKIARQEK